MPKNHLKKSVDCRILRRLIIRKIRVAQKNKIEEKLLEIKRSIRRGICLFSRFVLGVSLDNYLILSFHESKNTSDRHNPVVDILNVHRKIRRLKEIKKEVKNTRNYRTSTINSLILLNNYLLIIMYNIIPPLV